MGAPRPPSRSRLPSSSSSSSSPSPSPFSSSTSCQWAAARSGLLAAALLLCGLLASLGPTTMEPGTAASKAAGARLLVRSSPQPQYAPLGGAATAEGKPAAAAGPSPLAEWTRFVQGFDNVTAAAQRAIEEWQNPPDCAARRYLLWRPNNFGIGSDLHTIGLGLAWAMDTGRVLLYHPETEWLYTSAENCPEGLRTPDCYFHPLSKCQYMAPALLREGAATYRRPEDEPRPEAYHEWQGAKTLVVEDFWHLWGNVIPGVVPNVSDWRGRLDERGGVSWWRAQSTRYLVRPNARLLNFTRGFFANRLKRYPPLEGWSPLTSPPPERAICVHVRHGDKAEENMRLVPLEEYLAAAAKVADEDPSLSRSIFLSTDNQTLIDGLERGLFHVEGAATVGTAGNFTFYYTAYERWSNASSPMALAQSLGGGYFGSVSLANLILGAHPNCAAFIETGESNWCRLIDELRRTDGVRHDAPYVDFAPGEWRL